MPGLEPGNGKILRQVRDEFSGAGKKAAVDLVYIGVAGGGADDDFRYHSARVWRESVYQHHGAT